MEERKITRVGVPAYLPGAFAVAAGGMLLSGAWGSLPPWIQGVASLFTVLLIGSFFRHRPRSRSQVVADRLRESEERWRRLVEGHPEPIYVTVDGRIKYINPSGARIFGATTPTELIGTSVLEFAHPDVLDVMKKRLNQVEQGESTEPLEHRMRRLDGEERIIVVQSVPVVYHGERAVQTVVRDVTEQRHTEQALNEREHYLESVLEQMPAGLIIVEAPSGRIVRYNKGAERLLGHSQLAAESVEEYEKYRGVYPDGMPYQPAEYPIARALQGETVLNEEVTYQRSGEDTVLLSVNAAPIRDDEGGIASVVCTFQDVTARKQTEQALQRSEERFRGVSEQAVDVVAIFDADGYFKYLSPSVEEVTGYPREALIGTDGFEPVHPEDLAAVRDAFMDAIHDPASTVETEVRYRHKDGSWRHLSIRGRRLPATDQGIEVLANVRDITEQIERERELIMAKNEAEKMNRLKSIFLANMSHEIRTPLTSIVGFADVLSRQVDSSAQELLEMIRMSGERLERTLTSVLDLAQLESRTLTLRPEWIDLRQEVRETASMFRAQAEHKGIELHADRSEAPLEVRVDRNALRRILTNLIANAVKFTEEGHVRVDVTVHSDSGVVLIRVEDTGIGISADRLDHIFEEFIQESQGYMRDYEGSGLGLSISRELAEMLGGTIHVESVKGEGSTFTVQLPRTAPDDGDAHLAHDSDDEASDDGAVEVQTPRAATGESGNGAAARDEEAARDAEAKVILLVEDNELTREVVPMLIEKADTPYTVDTAATAEEAMEKAKRTAYDLFLIDINLGTSTTGIDVMEAIRGAPVRASVPMVACTAYAMPGDEEKFLDAGFDAYISKPFQKKDLLATIREALNQSSSS